VRISLKVDVDTLRGTLEGVPALLRLFDRLDVRATFLFSLGPDHTGRAIRRVFRRGFLNKVGRTSITRHYGFKTLLYGTLLPGPNIGRRGAEIMRSVRTAGHEVGIHAFDHVRWQDFVMKRGAGWTRREMHKAVESFQRVFDTSASTHGAAGWQINQHALASEVDYGFAYASDTRGTHPFIPIVSELARPCPQLPTTLPTLDEIIGCNGCTEANAHERILNDSSHPNTHGHVYTLHAELEGMKLLPVMRKLLQTWVGDGNEIGALDDLFQSIDRDKLPHHWIVQGNVAGRSGTLAVQGPQGSLKKLGSSD